MGLLLEPGQRGLLVGKTGSGKSQNAMFQLRHTPVWPRFILDTKIEDFFFSVPKEGETLHLANNFEELKQMKTVPWDEFPDYTLIRPSAEEVQDFDALNEYTNFLYNNFGECFICVDELGNWHKNNLVGTGLLNLLTRGRSRKKTVLMATQRPAWISRSCLTEAEKFYIHRLTDGRDSATLGEVVPEFEKAGHPPQYHFWHYDNTTDMERAELWRPVPYTPIDSKKVFRRKWL